MHNIGEEVYFQGQYWRITNIRNNGRLYDLQSLVEESIVICIYASDLGD